MAARKRKIKLTDDWKERIRAGVIMDRLLKHVAGEVDMTNTQVNAAKILLSKVVPDLARTELSGEGGGPIKTESILGWIPEAMKRRNAG